MHGISDDQSHAVAQQSFRYLRQCYVVGSGHRSHDHSSIAPAMQTEICRANVVLQTCRAPSKTHGLYFLYRQLTASESCAERGIDCFIAFFYHGDTFNKNTLFLGWSAMFRGDYSNLRQARKSRQDKPLSRFNYATMLCSMVYSTHSIVIGINRRVISDYLDWPC